MTEEEFIHLRRPFYIDSAKGIVRLVDNRHADMSHARALTDMGMQWCQIIRGYFWETPNNENDFVMIYYNNYNIPDVNVSLISYLFAQFPTVQYVGLGCIIGKPGEIWEPQLKVYNNSLQAYDSSSNK